ncbi:hypothetical protein OUZ56_032194 [Daphnia magna]|uniref:Uncharacterized protein n=1 Tax=Daphnia magna TaxID=35525 RepID=A0ABQ9ZWG6_9CRUS|nr:hypothetical protein OUZ56_032194 [Daphnia magna]
MANRFTLPIKMDRSYQDMSIPIVVKTFGLIVFPILPKSGFEIVFLRPAPTQFPMVNFYLSWLYTGETHPDWAPSLNLDKVYVNAKSAMDRESRRVILNVQETDCTK